MVLPVNTTTAAETLQSLGSYHYADTGSQVNAAKIDQMNAETQDFNSATARKLRETQRQADITKAQDEIDSSNELKAFYNANPGFLERSIRTNMYSKLSKAYSDMADNDVNTVASTLGQAQDPKTGDVDPATYDQQWNKLSGYNPDLANMYPHPSVVANNPQARKLAGQLLAHGMMTAEQRFKDKELQKNLDVKQEMQGAMLDMKSQMLDQQMRYNTIIADMKSSRELQGRQYVADKRVEAAKLRADAAGKGGVADQKDFKDQVPLATAGIQEMLDEMKISPSKVDMQGLVANSFMAAQGKYEEQKQQYLQDKRDGKPAIPPHPPAEIAVDIARQIINDPGLLKKRNTWFSSDKINSSTAPTKAGSSPVIEDIKDMVAPVTPAAKSRQAEERFIRNQMQNPNAPRGRSLDEVFPKGTKDRERYDGAPADIKEKIRKARGIID